MHIHSNATVRLLMNGEAVKRRDKFDNQMIYFVL